MAKKKDKKIRPDLKLICNPGAGDREGTSARLEQAYQLLTGLGFRVDVALARAKAKATPIARAAAGDGIRLVVAMGGDGTVEAVASGLVGTKSRLGILPTGSYNNIARSLGVPEDLEAACALLKEGEKRRVDVGQVKGKKAGKLYFFEVVSCGLTAALLPEGQAMQKGRLRGLKEAIRTLAGYPTPTFRLTLDGESKIKTESLLATVANTPEYGVNFMEAPGASLEDGLLDVCLYPGFNKAELAAYFARIAQEGHAEDERVQRYRARKVKIKSEPKVAVTADSFRLGKGTVKIRVLPGALRVMAGPAGLAQEPPPAEEALPAPVAPVGTDGQDAQPAPSASPGGDKIEVEAQ
jgi:diacylglycerol kinase (ATP)